MDFDKFESVKEKFNLFRVKKFAFVQEYNCFRAPLRGYARDKRRKEKLTVVSVK